MNLVSIMDDSSSEKIRKSIFVYAFLIFFVAWYELEITAPSAFFSSLSNSSDGVVRISYESILFFLLVFQSYLIVRARGTVHLSKAMVDKSWRIDESKGVGNGDEILREIKKFVEFYDSDKFPNTKEYSDFVKEMEELHEFYKGTTEEINGLMLQFSNCVGEFSSNKPPGDMLGPNHSMLDRCISDLEEARNHSSEIYRKLYENRQRYNAAEETYKKILSEFPESALKELLLVAPSSIERAAKDKKRQIDIYDLYIPVFIAGLSILVAGVRVFF